MAHPNGCTCLDGGCLDPAPTIETLTDEQIKEAIACLDTDIAILYAALKIKTGKLATDAREAAVEIVNRTIGGR